jgi:hypothetical protein
MQALNGKLYGMTLLGGTDNKGTFFEYDPGTSTYANKTEFTGSNGSRPYYGKTIEIYLPVGVKEYDDFELTLSPNPCNGMFTLKGRTENSSTILTSIYDVQGRIIKREYLQVYGKDFSKTFTLSGYSKGLYTLQVISGDNIISKKIIVE